MLQPAHALVYLGSALCIAIFVERAKTHNNCLGLKHKSIDMLAWLSQRPLIWFLRSVLVLPSFVGIMLPRAQTEDSFYTAYDFCVKASAPRHLNECLCQPRQVMLLLNSHAAAHTLRQASRNQQFSTLDCM